MQSSTPSVLAVLVVKDGASWLKRVLDSLARQTHPRFAVLAVDNGSRDGSGDLLASFLGPRRVIRLEEDQGFPGAVRRAMETPAAAEADYLLLLHDDTVLTPGTVSSLVEAAGRIPGVGAVGPKVMDWESPRVLREVGFATDRFGYAYSPLEEEEIDQGQYDAPREVLFVSSAAMLVAGDAWKRAGPPDERLRHGGMDLDFCWRIRLSGFRVLVAPAAVVQHGAVGERGERRAGPPRRERYVAERAGLLSLLKNYRVLTLAWVLPIYLVQGIARLALYVVSRRFDRAGQVLGAWGWNFIHLLGTAARRARAQAVRQVPDREIARFMAPAGTRLSRWALQASSLLVRRPSEGTAEPGEEVEAVPLGRRVASLATAHPVAVGLSVAVVVTLVAFRGVLFVPHIEGGALPVFPADPGAFFREFGAGWRSTGFGGQEGASPALVALGVGSVITLGDPQLLVRLLVGLGPLLAGASCHVAVRRLGISGVAAVVAAGAYGLSAVTLWSASEGRVSALVLLVALPWLVARLLAGFKPRPPARPLRWLVGTGMALGLTTSFFPAAWVAVAAVVGPAVILPDKGGSRAVGSMMTVAAVAVGAALVFPLAAALTQAGGGGSVGAAVRPSFSDVLRLAPGPSPGSWIPALFLPVAGILGFVLGQAAVRRTAARSLATASISVMLAWLAGAGRLPEPVASPVAFLAGAAFSLSVLSGLGARALASGVRLRRAAFGAGQLTGAALVTVLSVGLGAQTIRSLGGDWAVGESRVPPAWPVVASADPGVAFRVLWLAPPGRSPLPPPAGDPEGSSAGGGSAVSYAVTGRGGRSILAVALPTDGPAYPRLDRILSAMLADEVRHAGALLAPLGIRFVVAGDEALSPGAAESLGAQVDLDLIQRAGGLSIYRNARALPPAALLPGQAALDAARSPSLLAATVLDPATTAALAPDGGATWAADVDRGEASLVSVADTFSVAWRLEAPEGSAEPFPAFGWGLGFEAQAGTGSLEARFEGQLRRRVELLALAALWIVAVWMVRRTARDERPVRRRAVADEPVAARAPTTEPVG
jgi:GT2 family glycosyltransferase